MEKYKQKYNQYWLQVNAIANKIESCGYDSNAAVCGVQFYLKRQGDVFTRMSIEARPYIKELIDLGNEMREHRINPVWFYEAWRVERYKSPKPSKRNPVPVVTT